MNLARVSVVIRGRVQGVGFRAHTLAEARRHGLVGWVRNRPDGSVELAAEGRRSELERFLVFCHEGPPSAEVSEVVLTWGLAQGTEKTFQIVGS